MMTEVLKVNAGNIGMAKVNKAAGIIKEGGLVAFPTETVYGLGADALNPKAVVRIFEAKNRPLDDPLIVHITEKKDLFTLAKDISDTAHELAREFWPGPLTLVLKKYESIPDIVTAGLDTVAIRMPANEVALSLIRAAGRPIAAPSANLFGRPSPVTAQQVLEDLGGRIDMVIDGGKTSIGVESTVLDLTQEIPTILRPGGISIERLKEIIKSVRIYKQEGILAPGMYPRHYAPRAKVVLVEGDEGVQIKNVLKIASSFNKKGYRFGIMAKEEHKKIYGEFFAKKIGESATLCGGNVKTLGPGDDLTVCASHLFSALREFDREGVDFIIVEGVIEDGIGMAIMDRLRKAVG